MLSKVVSFQTSGRALSQFYTTKANPDIHKMLTSIGGIPLFERLKEIMKSIDISKDVKSDINNILTELHLQEALRNNVQNSLSTSLFNNGTITPNRVKHDLEIIYKNLEKTVSTNAVFDMLYGQDLKELSHVMKLLNANNLKVNNGPEL